MEPGEPGAAEPPQSILVNQQPPEPQQNGHEDHKHRHGLRKKVKKLIRPDKEEEKENNNNTKIARTRTRNSLHPKGSVTFNDVPTGVLKEVVLHVDPSRHNYGRRATLSESLFGIVPGHFNSRSHNASKDRRIMIQGLLPGHEAMRSGNVKIGGFNFFS